MFDKIKNFLIKNGLYLFVILTILIFIVIIIFSNFFGKKALTKVVEKMDKIIDKSTQKIESIKIQTKEAEIKKQIQIESSDKEKAELNSQLNNISKISDRQKRLQELIKLNKSIKIKGDKNG